MPGAEAAFDGLVAIVIGALLVIRLRERKAGKDVPAGVAIATGVVLGLVAVFATMVVIGWLLAAT